MGRPRKDEVKEGPKKTASADEKSDNVITDPNETLAYEEKE